MPAKLPANTSYQWIQYCLKFSEKHYVLFLSCGLFTMVLTICSGMIPYLGQLIAPALGFLVLLGEMRFLERIFRGERLDFEKFLQVLFDQEFLRKQKNYFIVLGILGLASVSMQFAKGKGVGTGLSFIITLFMITSVFAAFSERNKTEPDVQGSLQSTIQVLGSQWLPLLLFAFMYAAGSVVSAALCLVPFFFYFVPMMFPWKYVIYTHLFENWDLDFNLAHIKKIEEPLIIKDEQP